MSTQAIVRLGFLLTAIICIPSIAFSQWVENGVPVVSESAPQSHEVAVSDGAGGAYVVWVDQRQDSWQMLTAQRINEGGEVTWIADGIQVCAIDTLQIEPSACLAADGSLYVAWRSLDGYTIRAMAQRILPDGTLAWGLDGVELGTSPGTLNDVKVCPGIEGGAVFAWLENPGAQTQVRVNSLDTEGNSVWGGGGYQITSSPVDKAELCIASDGLGGAYLAWVDLINEDVFAEWILMSGMVFWGSGSGVPVCNAINAQNNISMISDGTGGVIVSWTDFRTDSFGDIYAQKLEPRYGSPIWSNGAAVCVDPNTQGISKLVPAGYGGAYVLWLDARDQAYDLYIQKLGGTGAPEWAGNGIAVCDVPGAKYFPVAVSDGVGGVIVAWQDRRGGSTGDLYASRIDPALNFLWGYDGLSVCTQPMDQLVSSVIPDGEGGAMFVWSDDRLLFDTDVYAQRIDRFGKWGFPGPYVFSIRDVPGDQGGEVRVAWYASRLDINPLAEIFYYTIWRAIDTAQASKLIAEGATLWEEGTTLKADSPEPSLRLGDLKGEPYFWTKVGEVESSHYIDAYAATVPTLFDSTATVAEPHYFQVIAHGYVTPEHWYSDVVTGRSVDNLAPAAPSGLAGARVYDPTGLDLSWSPNTEVDLAGYEVFRGASADFVPGAGNFVTSTADTLAFDEGWSNDGGYWYKVAAVDVHGNVSPFAVLAPSTVSSVPTASVPAAPLIEQNFPNPFNPQTTIAFEIPGRQDVTLRVFDLSGHLMRNLILGETRAPGRHEVVWNGRDDAGRQVASGTYFYRLEVGEYSETKRMVLVK